MVPARRTPPSRIVVLGGCLLLAVLITAVPSAAAFVTPRTRTTSSSKIKTSPLLLLATRQPNDSILVTSTDNDGSTAATSTSRMASFLLSAAVWTSALAVPSQALALDSSVFIHDYNDPQHPQCRRQIQKVNGNTLRYSGTNVGSKGLSLDDENDGALRGCSPPEIRQFGLKTERFDVLMDTASPTIISLGDGIHEGGVWDDGILWKDGSKWMVQEKTMATQIGEWITFSYIGFSLVAGVFGLGKMYKRSKLPQD